MTSRAKSEQPTGDATQEQLLTCNDVHIIGRLSKAPQERALPSGDPLVTFVVVVDRPVPKRDRAASRAADGEEDGGTARPRAQTIDSLDCVAWTAMTRRRALALLPGDVVEVKGAVRRRFWSAGPVKASRYEVEAASVRRVARAG